MHQGQEDREVRGFGVAEGFGAVDAEADAVEGLGEGGEEVEERTALPGGEVDLDGLGGGERLHGSS